MGSRSCALVADLCALRMSDECAGGGRAERARMHTHTYTHTHSENLRPAEHHSPCSHPHRAYAFQTHSMTRHARSSNVRAAGGVPDTHLHTLVPPS